MKRGFILFFLFSIVFTPVYAQELNSDELSYSEFLGYVKKYHPLLKQAGIEVSKAEASLMASRGGFDPKIEVDYDKKVFKGTDYYSLLNSSFKIPTWYGIEFKAGFDDTSGQYLNPQNRTPEAGLTSLGINVPLGQGLFINQRMADVREGKLMLKLGDAERKLKAIEVLYKASEAYFEWKRSYAEAQLYKDYMEFAKTRFKGVQQLIELGDSPAIDSIEAGITVKSRELNLENANLKLGKAKLKLSNFLWIKDVPVELEANMIPEQDLIKTLETTLQTSALMGKSDALDFHPKIQAIETKLSMLEINRKLKANMLLPKLNVGYNYISEPDYLSSFNADDYKFNFNFSVPVFLRKERGNLKLAKLKIKDMEFDLSQQRLELKNKIKSQQLEIESLKKQKNVIDTLVANYTALLNSEEKLFSFGESSMFLINSRENNLVNAKLSQIGLDYQYFTSNAELFRIMANPD